jgi:hypothetical protein
MTDRELAERIVEWARATEVSLLAGYPYLVSRKYGELPDIAVAVASVAPVQQDPRFPYSQLRGLWLDIYDVEASVMSPPGETQAEEDTSDTTLRNLVGSLVGSAQEDPMLGGRLDEDPLTMVSPQITREFPGFSEYEDGTRGRLGVIRMAVGRIREDFE